MFSYSAEAKKQTNQPLIASQKKFPLPKNANQSQWICYGNFIWRCIALDQLEGFNIQDGSTKIKNFDETPTHLINKFFQDRSYISAVKERKSIGYPVKNYAPLLRHRNPNTTKEMDSAFWYCGTISNHVWLLDACNSQVFLKPIENSIITQLLPSGTKSIYYAIDDEWNVHKIHFKLHAKNPITLSRLGKIIKGTLFVSATEKPLLVHYNDNRLTLWQEDEKLGLKKVFVASGVTGLPEQNQSGRSKKLFYGSEVGIYSVDLNDFTSKHIIVFENDDPTCKLLTATPEKVVYSTQDALHVATLTEYRAVAKPAYAALQDATPNKGQQPAAAADKNPPSVIQKHLR